MTRLYYIKNYEYQMLFILNNTLKTNYKHLSYMLIMNMKLWQYIVYSGLIEKLK